MKISIIIPVYKAEKYIERCARSLMEQTMKEDIEFIFVNDCTPDDSITVLLEVVADYPDRKAQVRILDNEKNLGPSATRQYGISQAQGVYLGFCDSDDWVEPEMYETLYRESYFGNKDIVVANYIEEKTDGPQPFQLKEHGTPQEALACLDDWHQFSWAMWNQIIRKSILAEEILHICPTKFREDTYLMMRCYYKAKSIAYVDKAFYHYNLRGTDTLIHTRDLTQKGWYEQKQNMDQIASLLYETKDGYYKYHRAVNCFKFMLKLEFRESFPSLRDFYSAYRESHSDGVQKESYHASIKNRIMLHLVYNTCYPIFKLLQG